VRKYHKPSTSEAVKTHRLRSKKIRRRREGRTPDGQPGKNERDKEARAKGPRPKNRGGSPSGRDSWHASGEGQREDEKNTGGQIETGPRPERGGNPSGRGQHNKGK